MELHNGLTAKDWRKDRSGPSRWIIENDGTQRTREERAWLRSHGWHYSPGLKFWWKWTLNRSDFDENDLDDTVGLPTEEVRP